MDPTFVNALPFTVVYGRGPNKGKEEEITYRELDLLEIYTWAKLYKEKRTPDLIALGTGRTLSWVCTLSFGSAAALAKAIFDLNFPNALSLAKDPVMASLLRESLEEAVALVKTMDPEELEKLLEVAKATGGSSGNGSSPTPPPSGSATETGSGSSASLPPDSAP